jgi:hypothetical protein
MIMGQVGACARAQVTNGAGRAHLPRHAGDADARLSFRFPSISACSMGGAQPCHGL